MAATRDLVVQVTADVSGLNSGMAKGAQSLAMMEKQAREAEKQIKKIGEAGAGFQRLVNDFAGVTQAQSGAARASAEAFQEFARLQDAVDDLRSSLDPAYASTKRYEAALGTLDDALARGVISTEDHAASVRMLEGEMTGAVKSAGGLQNAVRGAAQQVSQIGQQAMATGNFVQALAIQLPDLGLAFGAVGAAAGLVAGVALPMVINAFSGADKAAKTAEESLSNLEAALDSYREHANIAALSTGELKEQFGQFAAQMRSDAQWLMQVDLGRAQAALSENAAGISESLAAIGADFADLAQKVSTLPMEGAFGGALTDGVLQAKEDIALLRENMEQTATAIGLTVPQALQLRDALNSMAEARGMNGLAEASQQALESIRAMFPAGSDIPPVVQEIVLKLEGVRNKAVEATTAMNQLKDAAPGGDWMNAANRALEDTIGFIRQAKSEMQNLPIMTGSGQLIRPSELYGNMAGRGMPADAQAQVNDATAPASPSGGGGGGKESQLDQLRQQFATKAQLELDAYATEQQQLQAALDAKIISMARYQELAEQMQKDHQDKMAAIDVWQYGTGVQKAASFFGDMASIMEAGGDKTLQIAKSFGAAQALVNAWTGASEALKLPFPGNLLAFGKVLATGFSAVNAIKGAGRGGSGGSAGVSAASGSAQSPLVVNIAGGFDPNKAYMGSVFDSFIQELRDRGGNRGVLFA